MAVSKDSINGDTITPQCQLILFNLNPPIMVNIFKWFSIIYGKYTKKALPSPHVLVPHCTVLLLTCCVENIQETGFSINYYLFPVGILRREKHSLGYHGAPFTSNKVLKTQLMNKNQSNSKLGKLNRQVSKENTQWPISTCKDVQPHSGNANQNDNELPLHSY